MNHLFIDHLNELQLTKKKIKDNLSDTKHLTKNYYYLKRLNERLNLYTYKKLNQIHNVNFDKNYWTILNTNWQWFFLEFVFEKWNFIKKNYYKIHIKEKKNYNFYLSKSDDIFQLIENKKFNLYISSKIINNNKIQKKTKNIFCIGDNDKKIDIFEKLLIYFFNKKIIKFENIFINIPLNKFHKLWLAYKFNSLFLSLPNQNFIFKKKINQKIRNNFYKDFSPQNNFEKLIIDELQNILPLSMLENYYFYKEKYINLKLPNKPKNIICYSGIWANNLLSFYLAEKKKISNIILLQHGALYGSSKFHFHQFFEEMISNIFVTWGWKEKKNHLPIGHISSFKPKKKTKIISKILLVAPGEISPRLIASDFDRKSIIDIHYNAIYLSKFVKNLKKYQITLRLKIVKNFNTIKKFYLKNGAIDKFSTSNTSKDSDTKNALVICLYESTFFYEMISVNTPVILLLSKKRYNFIKAKYKKKYQILLKNDLLFLEKENLVKFLEKTDLREWWLQKKTQKALNKFKNGFFKFENNKNIYFKKILSKIN